MRTLEPPRDMFGRPGVTLAAAVFVLSAFLTIGLVRMYPYHDDITVQDSTGDDWLNYKLNALSILDGGLRMPSVDGPYYTPGGFLYNYFVAAVFAVFGRSTAYVYVLQYLFLGLAAVLIYFLARRRMSPGLALGLLFAVAVFYYEAFEYWVGRLLSENLLIVFFAAALLLTVAGIERDSRRLSTLAGIFAGLVVLTRQNMLLFPVALGTCVLLFNRNRRGVTHFVTLGVASFLTTALQPLRNYYVSRHLFARAYGSLLPSGDVSDILALMMRKALFCIGILIGGWDLSGAEIVIHRRWLFLNIAAVLSVALLVWRKRFSLADALCVSTVIIAWIPFIVMPALGGYGLRFQTPFGGLLLFLTFRGGQVVLESLRSRLSADETGEADSGTAVA